MNTSAFYSKPECEVVLIQHESTLCQSYRVNSISDYNRTEFDVDDWD